MVKPDIPSSLRRAMDAAGLIHPNEYEPTARAAKRVGVARETLRDAAARGDVATVKTLSGFVLVNVASAHQWLARRAGVSKLLYDSELWGSV